MSDSPCSLAIVHIYRLGTRSLGLAKYAGGDRGYRGSGAYSFRGRCEQVQVHHSSRILRRPHQPSFVMGAVAAERCKVGLLLVAKPAGLLALGRALGAVAPAR